jgi:CDP-diacylglycerol--glycerol-3-phosphate 3-phosphatidyltransferase
VGIANKLTLIRLGLSPVFVVVFILGGRTGGQPAHVVALGIAILFEITDLLDGYLARSRKQTTDFGKLFDPMADSISRFSVFLCFLWGGYAHLGIVALIFYRDCIVAYVRIAAARAGVVMAARLSGKMKAVTQGVIILTILVLIVLTSPNDDAALDRTRLRAQWLMLVVAVVTLWSGIDYVRSSLPVLRSLLRRKS